MPLRAPQIFDLIWGGWSLERASRLALVPPGLQPTPLYPAFSHEPLVSRRKSSADSRVDVSSDLCTKLVILSTILNDCHSSFPLVVREMVKEHRGHLVPSSPKPEPSSVGNDPSNGHVYEAGNATPSPLAVHDPLGCAPAG